MESHLSMLYLLYLRVPLCTPAPRHAQAFRTQANQQVLTKQIQEQLFRFRRFAVHCDPARETLDLSSALGPSCTSPGPLFASLRQPAISSPAYGHVAQCCHKSKGKGPLAHLHEPTHKVAFSLHWERLPPRHCTSLLQHPPAHRAHFTLT